MPPLSAVGLIPLVGDAGRTAGVVVKFVSVNPRLLKLSVTLWASRQFRKHDTARRIVLRAIGVRRLDRYLDARGWRTTVRVPRCSPWT